MVRAFFHQADEAILLCLAKMKNQSSNTSAIKGLARAPSSIFTDTMIDDDFDIEMTAEHEAAHAVMRWLRRLWDMIWEGIVAQPLIKLAKKGSPDFGLFQASEERMSL